MGRSRIGRDHDWRGVAFVTTSLGHYGADAQVVALAQAFVSRGWRVGVVSLVDPERPTDELTSAGIRVASLGMRAVCQTRGRFGGYGASCGNGGRWSSTRT